jgi:2-methylcitrate dehydratase PrpD
MEALVAGYEVFALIGIAANEGFHHKGMHATPMCGIFAASLLSGKINNHTVEELTNALGICGSQSAGIQQFLIDGSWVKIIHPGWAVHSGIIASKLASNGFIGPLEIFEGKLGFFSCHLGLDNVKLDCLTRDLGDVWETLNMSIKRYPCCHAIHTFIDGVLDIQANQDIQWDKIKHITCKVNPLGKKIVCDPIEIKRNPSTPYGGRFSMPYAIAITLLDGELGLEQFSEEKINDPRVLEITKKIDCIEEASLPRTGGNITIEMEDGSQYNYMKEHPIGSPLFPLGEHQVVDKFKRNVRGIITKDQAKQIISNVLNIESIDNITTLMMLLE